MRGVKIPILEEDNLSIFIIGAHDGKVRGYEFNNNFFWKKDRNNFLFELKEFIPEIYDEIILKIEENEDRHKKRHLGRIKR